MRVITGSARGTRLEAPEGLSTRPTSEMTKEAIFSVLHFELEGADVLDLFSGSGQMGIEALSRGARSCVFVDASRQAQEAARRNLAAAKLGSGARVAAMEAASFLSGCRDLFDIAILDPPYGQGLLEATLPLLAPHMKETGVIVCEMDKTETPPETAGAFPLYKIYRYGKAKVATYRKTEE